MQIVDKFYGYRDKFLKMTEKLKTVDNAQLGRIIIVKHRI